MCKPVKNTTMKEYIKPAIDVVELQLEAQLCASVKINNEEEFDFDDLA